MVDVTLFELHVHDGLSFSKASAPEPEAAEPAARTGAEETVAPGIEPDESGPSLTAVGALVVLGVLAAVAVALKRRGGGTSVPDGVDELSEVLSVGRYGP